MTWSVPTFIGGFEFVATGAFLNADERSQTGFELWCTLFLSNLETVETY